MFDVEHDAFVCVQPNVHHLDVDLGAVGPRGADALTKHTAEQTAEAAAALILEYFAKPAPNAYGSSSWAVRRMGSPKGLDSGVASNRQP